MLIHKDVVDPSTIKLDTNFVLKHDLETQYTREDGYHVAAIARNIAVKLGIKDWELQSPWEDRDTRNQFAPNWDMFNGLAWEAAIMQTIKDVHWQPTAGTGAHILIDGHKVFGNPDGVNFGPWHNSKHERVIGHECKSTKTSAADKLDFKSLHLYHWQAQAYGQSEMLDTRFWIFHVMHVNGAYEWYRGGPSSYVRYWVEYTEAEMFGLRSMFSAYLSESKLTMKTSIIDFMK